MPADYPRTVSLAMPEAMAADGNQLALVLGEHADDAQTFTTFGYQAADGTSVCVKQTRVRDSFVTRATSLDPLVAPDHAPGADLTAAENARAALQFDVPAQAGVVAVWLDATFTDGLAGLNVTRKEDVA